MWSAIFDGRGIEAREAGVFIDGTPALVCSAESWQQIGGYFTDSAGWLTPAAIREQLTDWITDAGYADKTDRPEMCALVDLGLELSQPALRVWHREGFAELTNKVSRKQLTSKVNSQRAKIVRRIARTFSASPPTRRRRAYQYPDWSPQSRVPQLQLLIEQVHKPGRLLESLVRQANTIRHRRTDWRDHLPANPWRNRELRSVVDEGTHIAVHDRLAFYLHVLYGPSTNDGRTYALTRFSPQAAAKPEYQQMLRVGGRVLAKWFDACPKRVEGGPDFEHQVSDAVLAMRQRRLQGSTAVDRLRDHRRKAKVLVDLAVADVIGTALNGRPDGVASRWLTAGCLDAIVSRVQAQATHERAPDSVNVLLERRDLDIELDAILTKDIEIIVDQDFFDEYGTLPHIDKKRS